MGASEYVFQSQGSQYELRAVHSFHKHLTALTEQHGHF